MQKNLRFWEIDSLRGIAIMMMIVFHFLFDLAYFGGYSFNVSSGFWLYFARATAAIFIFLVGVSLTISFSRVSKARSKGLFPKYLKRGLGIFACGMAITLITWIFFRQEFIIFGVLHFIGISIILAYPFIRWKYKNLAIGAILIAAGLLLRNFTFNFQWLMWLGFVPKSLYTFDYFPLLPWFGVVMIGLFFGNMLYANGRRQFRIFSLPEKHAARFFSFLGRHSLLIYLVHQPLLILVFYLAGMARI